LLAVLKAAYEHGKELREGFIKQVLVKPTQVTPDPGEHHCIGEGIAGSAIQTNRSIGAAYDVHHIGSPPPKELHHRNYETYYGGEGKDWVFGPLPQFPYGLHP
jgi:hypothetical protein